VPRIADHFVQAKIKHFDSAQKDQALVWLETVNEPDGEKSSRRHR
jgi:hypothetical protein